MMKKTNAAKSTKTLSKQEDLMRQQAHYTEKQYLIPQDFGMITNLEKLIRMEITTREQSYQELLEMINHLKQTKKSKIPAKYQKLTAKKFFSPNKHIYPKQNQASSNITRQVSFPTQRRDENSNSQKLSLIEKELDQVKAKINELSFFSDGFNSATAEISIIKTDIQEQQNYLRRDIISHCNKVIEKENQEIAKFISERIKNQSSILEEFTKKIAQRFVFLEKSLEDFESRVEREVKVANENIVQTKQTIQQNLYGEVKSRDKVLSNVSIELSEMNGLKKKSEAMEKIGFVERRVQGLERRMGLVYEQFLRKPLNWSPTNN